MRKLLPLLLLLFCFAASNNSYGQTDTTKTPKLVIKTDGTQYVGVILSDDGREILLETESLGKIYIRKSDIKSITEVPDTDIDPSGKYEPEGAFTSRYYFTNNALPIKKGEHYSMIHLYGPEIHFSAGKGFSAGIMTTWGASPFLVALKQCIKTKNEKVNFSLGTIMGSSGYFNTFRGFGGMHWLTFTYGRPASNISFSGGYLYLNPGWRNASYLSASPGLYDIATHSIDDLWTDGNQLWHSPMLSIAGITQVGKRISFIFDSMISVRPRNNKTVNFVEQGGTEYYEVVKNPDVVGMFFLMPGMRFQKTPKNAFQVALAGVTYISPNQTFGFPVPQCSWFFKF